MQSYPLTWRHILAAIVVFGAWSAGASADDPTLKDAYKDDFLIGCCMANRLQQAYSPQELDLIARQFNAATPENCMKPKLVHPAENTWTFDDADAFVQFCEEHHMAIYGNTLVWHNQTPDWFFRDGNHPASSELLLKRMKAHIAQEMRRYKGKIRSWDVVNEALAVDDGPNFQRPCEWHDILGDTYVEQAFRFAHEADPAARLQYNDYAIESGVKFQKAMRLLKGLKDRDVPIDSVGIQGHWLLDQIPYADIENAIVQFSKLGLKVNITELDLDVTAEKESDLPELFKRQADQYARLFTMLRKHSDVIERVNFWGTDDGHSWLNSYPKKRTDYPLLFDRLLQPKPAFFSVIDVGLGRASP